MPAKAGIPYAASCRSVINVSEIPGHPAFAFVGDDDGTKETFPRRVAPELCISFCPPSKQSNWVVEVDR